MLNFAGMAPGCKFFSFVDIRDACHMIPVAPVDFDKLMTTTFICNFCYRYLSLVLTFSTTYFQYLMNKVYSEISYLDDDIIKKKIR